jgi:hypothetical protein
MIVVAGIVGGVAVVGTVIAGAYEDHSDYSDHSDWSEISPEDKYKKEINDLKYSIRELNDYTKHIFQEISDEFDIDIHIPNLTNNLEVEVNSSGAYIVGCDEIVNFLKLEINLDLIDKIDEKFGQKIRELESQKKEILALINRINEIELF